MSLVEEKYNKALDQMSGRQRVERTLSLFSSVCEMLTLQVSRKYGHLSDRAKRREVAQQLYLSDRGVQELLKKVRIV